MKSSLSKGFIMTNLYSFWQDCEYLKYIAKTPFVTKTEEGRYSYYTNKNEKI